MQACCHRVKVGAREAVPLPEELGRRRPRPINRRSFLGRMSLAALGGPALLEALAACSSDNPGVSTPGSGSSSSPAFKIASPSTPVTWPVDEAALIADGLQPEKGATLKLYNYADYIGPGVVK